MTARLYVTSIGNEAMLDIASMVSDGLTSHGVAHEIVLDGMPVPSSSEFQLVVAPHEFFPLFAEPRRGASEVEKLLPHVHMLNVEQPGSQWFELAWHYARRGRGVLDISREGVREFRRRGTIATPLPLGYSARLEAPGAAKLDERPIDILFFGHLSQRREEFFARHAAILSQFRCHLVLADVAKPRRTDTAGYYAGQARLELLAKSKIVLNVHSSDRSYFETHRALLALSNRCLLISETSRGTEPLVRGEHFVMGSLDDLPEQCVHYLSQPAARAAVTEGGYQLVSTTWTAHAASRALVELVRGDADRTSIAPVVSRPAATDDETLRRDVIRRIAEARGRKLSGDEGRAVVDNEAYSRSGPPAVSVIVTLYNYAGFVEECLQSVLASDPFPGGFELVVVDDSSTDESVAVVERIMAATAIPMRLVKKHLNTGLAEARNTGLELARGHSVFILDADNWIYPACLGTLRHAFEQGSYAAVYGMIRKFEDDGGEATGLLSAREWDVEELIREPYIDAMAMFDRHAVLSVGGYSNELIEHGWFGWEDYDLWLKLAAAGHHSALVPAVLSSYRVHPHSMIQRTNRSSQHIAAHLRKKFSDLIERHPGLDRYFGFPVDGSVAVARPTIEESSFEALQRHCSELHHQLAAVYASKSWKVTGPLRWAYRVLTER